MKKVYLTYSDDVYKSSRRVAAWTAKYIAGFDEVLEMGPEDIEDAFKEKNKKIFAYSRGAGLWLWKPYIVLKTLESMNFGDTLFYADAGACFVRSAKALLNSIDDDIWCCEIPTIEEEFTKEECFVQLDCDSSDFRRTNQRIATFFAVRKTDKSVDFIRQWLCNCENESLMAPLENVSYKTHKLFSHREDQSIFSLLTKKNGYRAHQIPTTSFFFPMQEQWNGCTIQPLNRPIEYPICIFLHKKKNISWKKVVMHRVYISMPRVMLNFIARKRRMK